MTFKWTLKFNASKCKVLSITRKRHPLVAIYIVNDKTLEHLTSQKDVGVMISSDLKWKTQIYEQVSNANRMLGMIKRSTIHVKNLNTRSSLYLTLARSHLAFACQVWSPQTITTCMELEKRQRRATKFILGLPFKGDTPYETRLASLKMLPLCYWHEYLDILFLFECANSLVKTDVVLEQVANQAINLRSTNNSLVTYNIPKVRTLCHQNSYMVRVSRVWNSLPDELRNPDISFMTFKCNQILPFCNTDSV